MSFPPSVGRYRIDRVLGSGAFASVWLGHDDALDSQVAIKVLSGSLIDDLDVRNRFLEEARILRRADSERLVRVHDIGELPDGRPYFVMSYADRGTLGDRMRERPLPVNEALALAEEIAYGVEVINTLGVIHRDLKPSNVLFQSTNSGGEKLLIADLGLAKALAHASGAFTLPVGTPGYMSPEQARFGGGLDVRADVYGLGALTYHMVTGRAPGPAPVKTPPSEMREGLPPAADEVILRALETEREKRWPTAEAFAEALSTLRPTVLPGAAVPPAYAAAPVIEPDATIQDYYQDGTVAQKHGGQAQGGQAQGGQARGGQAQGAQKQGAAPERPPAPAAGQAPQTIFDQPPPSPSPSSPDDVHTSEMRVPPKPAAGGEPATIVDQPAGGPFGGRVEPPTVPDEDEHTVTYQPPPSPGGGGGGGVGDDVKTAAFPMQQGGPPQNAPAPHGPVGPGQGPPPPMHGPGPGGPGGPGPGPGGGYPPPPTGFQPPPPGQGRQPSGAKGGGLLGKLKGAGGGKAGGPGSGGSGGGGAPRKFATPLIITAVVLVLAVVGGLALGALFSGDDGGKKGGGKKSSALPADFAEVSDTSGKIKAAVPKAWPKQQEPTWSPSTVRLNDAQPRPVLRATPNKAAFLGDGAGPGVFIGMTTDVQDGKLPPPTAAVHPRCTKSAPENYTTPDKALSGTITRYTGCKSGTASVTEVGLKDASGKFGLWIRVKETDGRAATKDILDHLKVTGP
ncbi:serine/threonine-protein kinase [Actinomadura sp. NEAU-AAG7]|uniref:serine/threonine-protein kinase n=1 Tax=Actinomadura sp. NEAU-AAG7 TaxID=2839640 RepID=UPI001BE46B77|nr:serine/threonine-protein kinase [Actinomadura sp. NEAU-AAG7]MBT2208303.1 serine/threonine protein kinase [Actinomadura sp. NEAU-AAG7]